MIIQNKFNQYPLIMNIQRFSLNDGPGIRTTVFLKGCSLRCPWCSNPESLNPFPEKYNNNGIEGVFGTFMSCEHIYDEISKDIPFYGKYQPLKSSNSDLDYLPGGVTFSGGEALLQIERLEPLLVKLKSSNIHMAVESGLFVSEDSLSIALKYFNLFYIDMKILNHNLCEKFLNGKLDAFLENLYRVFSSSVPVVIRIPLIYGYTDSVDNREKILGLLKKYKPIKVELIKGHNLGSSKYISLGLNVPELRKVSSEIVESFKKEIEKLGILVQVCRI